MKRLLTLISLIAVIWGVTAIHARAQDCISGIVFEDQNGNGTQDTGEPGIQGLTVDAISSAGVVLTQITDLNGAYQFCGLTPGSYFLFVELGSPDLSSTPPTQSVILQAGQSLTGIDFGIIDNTQLGVARGTAFFDLNGNGIHDPFEPAITNAQINLNGVAGMLTTTTDPNGNFQFERLPAGDYTIGIVANYPNTTWFSGPSLAFVLNPGQLLSNLQFILRPSPGFGSISDFICLDINADGLNDPATEPGIGQTVVQLLNAQGVVLDSAFSDGNGVYGFIGLPPGNYIVRAVFDPADYTPTTPVSYNVSLPANGFIRPGPFYFQPKRKIFQCGMLLNTFSADNPASSGDVLALRNIRNRTGAPMGVNMAWNAPYYSHPQWSKSLLGYVFGIAIDTGFNAYISTAAAGTYWYPLAVGNGSPIIYRINPYTGGVSNLVYASNAATVVGGNSLFNINTGLGNLTYNKYNQVLYVTNRHDQTINVIASMTNTSFAPGTVIQVFNPGFVGQAGTSQGVYGIGFNPVENRLYFARDPGTGNNAEIYSLSINAANGQIIGTELLEFAVRDRNVTDIAFSFDGRMLIAERKSAHISLVFQHTGSSGAWSAGQSIYVGGYYTNTNAAGGVDYVYSSFTGQSPPADGCDTDIAASGDALILGGSPQTCYGFAIIPGSGNSPGSFASLNSIFVDSDNDMTGNVAVKGLMGDVEVFDCECPSGCEQLGLTITPASAIPPDSLHSCCLILDYSNTGSQQVYGIEVQILNGVTFAPGYTIAGGLFAPNHNSTSVTITPTGFGPMPNSVGGLINFCMENVLGIPQYVVINYLDANYEILCSDTLQSQCMPERSCLYIVSDTLVCDSAGYKYIATVANPPGSFPVGWIKFNVYDGPNSSYTVTPTTIDLTADTLYPGEQTMIMFTINTTADLYGDSLCFILSAHDGPEERLCCAEIDTCIVFPLCDPCPYLGASVTPVDSIQAGECCYTLHITDTLTTFPNLITGLQVEILNPGVTFSGWNTLPALLSGWSYSPASPSNTFNWTHNSGLVPDGVNYPLFDFCVQGTTTTDSIYIAVNWIGSDSTVICMDTVAVYCPQCMTVVNDSLRCITNADGTQSYVYTFQVQNYSPFLVNAVGIVEHPSSSNNVTPDVIPIPALPAYVPGSGTVSTSGPISILIDAAAMDTFCLDLVLRQIIQDSVDITCCYVTHCFELPPCDSLDAFLCPDPSQIDPTPCTLQFDPVCGCDGHEYGNACLAEHAGVLLWFPGPCDPDSILTNNGEIFLQANEHQGGGVDLNWTLHTQATLDHFFLMRSIPGDDMEMIRVIPATQARINYVHLDEHPAFGVNRYRLVGVDIQGRTVYSNYDEVFVQWDQSEPINVSAFPVPARNELQVASSKQGPCTIEIIGPDGRTHSTKEVNFAGLPVRLDISSLSEGVFFLQLRYTDGNEAHQRFVKAE